MVAWKQGIMYKALYEPYGKANILNTRKPIEGVSYHKGVGSAAASAVARGIPPEVINRDMGIVDIKITTIAREGKKPIPVMLFTPDPHQRTNMTGKVSRKVISKKTVVKRSNTGITRIK
jgi:hypothetical protein